MCNAAAVPGGLSFEQGTASMLAERVLGAVAMIFEAITKRITCVIAICLAAGMCVTGTAAAQNPKAGMDGASSETIAPGTAITMANWQQYRTFMPEGMAALFEGKYFWKMPSDVRIEIGPT